MLNRISCILCRLARALVDLVYPRRLWDADNRNREAFNTLCRTAKGGPRHGVVGEVSRAKPRSFGRVLH